MPEAYQRILPSATVSRHEIRDVREIRDVVEVGHIAILDGWRALGILLVLTGHLLPLGPKSWGFNMPLASAGMAVFFVLSGFLITKFLLERPDAYTFLCRRAFRILPLAWVAIVVLGIVNAADAGTWLANMLFVANLPPQRLLDGGNHHWSLGVEVQFYAAIALLVALAGRRGLYLLPVACLLITGLRVFNGVHIDIVTWHRVDEILAGATIALAYRHLRGARWLTRIPGWAPVLLLLLVFVSAHPQAGAINYVRPYLAAAAIGLSLFVFPEGLRRLFTSKTAVYIALISYALYIFHGMFAESWLGSGDVIEKYAKRPLLLLVTFGTAHASTFWFEQPMILVGKRVSQFLSPTP